MDLPILIILAVVCIAIGFILDNLLHSLRGEKAPVSSPGEGGATGEVVSGPDEITPPPSESEQVQEEVFRVWRGPLEKDLIIEMSGNKARSPSDLNLSQLDRLGSALQELSTWLGQGVSPSSHPAELPGSVPDLIEEEPGDDRLSAEIRRPSFNPIDIVSNALRADVRKPPRPADKSLAAQVDAVLQEKLKGTPLEKRGIRLTDMPDGGLLVQVGFDRFAGVEEVPDIEIREIIHSAVAEWRKRTLPGK
jgi:hypothetical protein